MTHHPVVFHPLLLLTALFVLPADSTARHVGLEPTFRVYCLFNPLDAGELQRTTALHEATLQQKGVEWVGIHRTAAAPVSLASIALDGMLANVDHLSLAVVRWLEDSDEPNIPGDRVLLEDTRTHRTFAGAGAGSDLRDIAEAAGLDPVTLGIGISTDVAVTTWGKVKELFR
jgi:hypothetical protein